MAYDNSMKGVLFKNDKRENDKHPHYKGEGEVNGVKVWIAAWINKSKKGATYMSLQFENKDGQQVPAPAAQDVPIDTSDFDSPSVGDDDDIPF